MAGPEPPARGLDPLLVSWAAGVELHRVVQARYGATGSNPMSSSGRFRPVYSGAGDARSVVPTIYAGENRETALAEGLLRGVTGGEIRRRLYRREVA